MADWILIEDCEDAWTPGTGSMTCSQGSGAYAQVGTYSARVDVDAGASADDVMMYENISSTDISGQRYFALYVHSTVALAAGDVQFGYDESADMASPEEWINIPAMNADTWYRFVLTMTTDTTKRNAVVSVGFRMHIDKGGFTLFADDVRAFCGYTLPTITNHLGTFSLFVGSNTPGLTAPTVNTISSMGKLTETLDLIPGNIDLATMNLSFIDDYSVHSDGFWGEVLKGSSDIKILLNEGAGDTFVFWGTVNRNETKFEELYVSGSTSIRVGTIMLVSVLGGIRDVTFTALGNQILNNAAYVMNTAEEFRWTRVADIFCAAIEVLFLQDYNSGDCYVTAEGGADLVYQESSTDHTFFELYARFQVWNDPVWAFDTYFVTAENSLAPSTDSFESLCDNPWVLLKDLARQFGFVPHHVFDVATGRHKIELLQRGRTLTDAVTLPVPTKSTISPVNPVETGRFRVFYQKDETQQWYSHDGVTASGVPPTGLNFVAEIKCFFVFYAASPTTYIWQRLWHYNGAGTLSYFDGVKVYKYADGTTTLYNSGDFILQAALVGYYVSRYWAVEQRTYNRAYHTIQGTVGGTTSHTKVSLMRENAIGGVNYGISEYQKNFDTGELKLTLVDI